MHCALARTCAVHEIYPLNILTNTNKRYYPRHWRGLEFCVVVREGGGGGGGGARGNSLRFWVKIIIPEIRNTIFQEEFY